MQPTVPAGSPDPIPLQELAVKLFQRAQRAGIEITKIDPEGQGPNVAVTVKALPHDGQALDRFIADFQSEFGWTIGFKAEASRATEPEVLDVEVLDAVPQKQNETASTGGSLARVESQGNFGLVPLSFNTSALSLIRTGDSQDIASHMLDDSSLLAALGSVPPYKVRGERALEAVQADIIALQNVHPVVTAAGAAGNLRWAVTELARRRSGEGGSDKIAGYIGSVASMLLTALGSVSDPAERSVFQKPYLDLLQSIDRPLADAVRKLIDPQSPGAREGFQTLFSRLLSISQFAEAAMAKFAEEGDGVPPAALPGQVQQAFLVGSLVLRQMLFTFKDETRQALVPVISQRFAEELRNILVEQDPQSRGLLLVLSGCRDITMDFFQAVLTRYVGEREEKRGVAKERPAFGKAPDTVMRGDAVECILGAACLMSPGDDGFFGDLDSRFDHAHPFVQAKFLQAMKFGLGQDEHRREIFLDRALAFLEEKRPEIRTEVRTEAKDLLRNFPRELAARLSAENCFEFRRLSEENRIGLLDEILLTATEKRFGIGLEKLEVLALVSAECELSGIKALRHGVLRSYLTDDFVAALPEPNAIALRKMILHGLAKFEVADDEKEAKRILGCFGFASISESFTLAAEKRAVDAGLAQKLILTSAEISSRYETEDTAQQEAIRSFTLNSVVPVFVTQITGKKEAAIHVRQVSGQLETTRTELSSAREELSRISPIAGLIRGHPGYKRASGDENFEQTAKSGSVLKPGALQVAQKALESAKFKKDAKAEATAQAEVDAVLNMKFPRVESYPQWPEELARIPLKGLMEILAKHREIDGKVKALKGKLSGIEGGEDLFTTDPNDPKKKVWAGITVGDQGAQQEAFRAEAREAALQGRILRLFLSSPAIDQVTAQKAYDQLPAHETSGALARFALAQRFTIVDSVTMAEAVEADESDGLRQTFIDELGIDIGPGEEAKQLEATARKYNPEQVFCDHFSTLLKMTGLDEEMRGLMRAVCEMTEAGIYAPRRPSENPLLAAILARLKKEKEIAYSQDPTDAWSSDANRDSVFTLIHGMDNLEPSEKGGLDREFRQVVSGWLVHWEPPRDLKNLSSPVMVQAVERYLQNEANDGRHRAIVAIAFGKKCLEFVTKLPHSQRRAYLTTLEIAERSIPAEIKQRKVTVELESKSGPAKFTIQPSELFATVISRIKEELAHESSSSGLVPEKPTLRLPFGQRADGGMGLLPSPAAIQRQLGSGGNPPPAKQ